ncbi:rCG28479 [Rattus norvegicus]|uniref:RCG28479 n=1 Tax=Rattus norvegicus TaxID=10116 RepID=A6HVE3_RAT|nr:rCG28479 [Rattus norvegicus]
MLSPGETCSLQDEYEIPRVPSSYWRIEEPEASCLCRCLQRTLPSGPRLSPLPGTLRPGTAWYTLQLGLAAVVVVVHSG